MKKRVFAMLMAAVMAFSLVACGNKTDNGGDAADNITLRHRQSLFQIRSAAIRQYRGEVNASMTRCRRQDGQKQKALQNCDTM